jgi:regulator of sigma E protease
MIGIQWKAESQVLFHQNPFTQVGNVVVMTFDVLEALVNPRSDVRVEDMSGPVGITSALIESARANILVLFFLVVLINVNLAIVNLLPIPVLDGGHITFALIEKLRGRPLPARFLAMSQTVFMLLFFALMAYITWHDIGREVKSAEFRKEARAAQNAPAPVFDNKGGKPEETAPTATTPAATQTAPAAPAK